MGRAFLLSDELTNGAIRLMNQKDEKRVMEELLKRF